MTRKLILTAIVLIISGTLKTFANPVSMIGAANFAGLQFQNSDFAAINSQAMMSFYSMLTPAIIGVTFVLLLVIWWSTLKGLYEKGKENIHE